VIDSKMITMRILPLGATTTADVHQHHSSTSRATPAQRLWRRLALSVERCSSTHYASFLKRTVRCRLDARHPEAHRFRTLDETVVWH
jgi:hypothetical protein